MEYLQITLRIILILPMLLILTLVTGRRKIGELPVFDFLVIIILASVVGADIADPNIPHLPTGYAIILIVAIQYIVSRFIIKNRKFGKLVTFGPTVVIQNAQFIKSNMKRIGYSVENILMYLRENDIFDLSEVEFAIVEDSGNVSVLKKSQYQPLTPNDIKMQTNYKGISVPVIIDGKVYDNTLKKLNLDKSWLFAELKNNGVNDANEVFYAEINTEGKLYISKDKEQGNITNEFKV